MILRSLNVPVRRWGVKAWEDKYSLTVSVSLLNKSLWKHITHHIFCCVYHIWCYYAWGHTTVSVRFLQVSWCFILILLFAVLSRSVFCRSFKVSQMMCVCINLLNLCKHQNSALEPHLMWVSVHLKKKKKITGGDEIKEVIWSVCLTVRNEVPVRKTIHSAALLSFF